MIKSKIFISFSLVISLFMCSVSLTDSFFYSIYDIDMDILSMIIDEGFNNVFYLNFVPALNILLMTIFLLNSFCLVLYIFKMDKGYTKILSFWNTISLIFGLVVFVTYVVSNILFYDLIGQYEFISLKFKIFRWIPRVLIFSIPTIYLIFTQVRLLKKSKYKKLTNTFIILSTYALSLIFLTIITFFGYFEIDYLLDQLRLKTYKAMLGEHVYFEGHANINYYLYYVIFLTVVFGTIMLFSRKKSKKQIK